MSFSPLIVIIWHTFMTGDWLHWSVSWLLDALIWGGEFAPAENLQPDEAVVYISNHASPPWPIAGTPSMPVRLHPSVIANMLAWDHSAGYV
jgi:hypothetical protein